MFLAHGPVGYITNEVIQKEKISKLKIHEQFIVGVFSILFGIFPDIDILILMMTKYPAFRHHEIFTHTPIFYLGIWLTLSLIYKILKKYLTNKTSKLLNEDLIQILLNTFLISTMSHLAMDLLVGDIMLFYPIFNTRFTILKYLLEPSLFQGYALSTLLSIEFILVAIFIKQVFHKYFKKEKELNVLTNTILISTVMYFIFSFTITQFTYNNSYLTDVSGNINYDIDYDGVSDQSDLDVGNDGFNNIEDIDNIILSREARNIVESNKLAVGVSKNILDNIKLTFGALDSYSVVSQSFYNAHKPLSPVLRDFYNKDNTYTYNAKYNPSEVLYTYLKSNEEILELNLKADITLPEGKIFFVINAEGNVKNLGITLSNNELATVLDTDSRLQLHTYTELVSKLEKGERIEIQE